MAAPTLPVSIGAPAELIVPQASAANRIRPPQGQDKSEQSSSFKSHLNSASDRSEAKKAGSDSVNSQSNQDNAGARKAGSQDDKVAKSSSRLDAKDTNAAKAQRKEQSSVDEQKNSASPASAEQNNTAKQVADENVEGSDSQQAQGKELPLNGKELPQTTEQELAALAAQEAQRKLDQQNISQSLASVGLHQAATSQSTVTNDDTVAQVALAQDKLANTVRIETPVNAAVNTVVESVNTTRQVPPPISVETAQVPNQAIKTGDQQVTQLNTPLAQGVQQGAKEVSSLVTQPATPVVDEKTLQPPSAKTPPLQSPIGANADILINKAEVPASVLNSPQASGNAQTNAQTQVSSQQIPLPNTTAQPVDAVPIESSGSTGDKVITAQQKQVAPSESAISAKQTVATNQAQANLDVQNMQPTQQRAESSVISPTQIDTQTSQASAATTPIATTASSVNSHQVIQPEVKVSQIDPKQESLQNVSTTPKAGAETQQVNTQANTRTEVPASVSTTSQLPTSGDINAGGALNGAIQNNASQQEVVANSIINRDAALTKATDQTNTAPIDSSAQATKPTTEQVVTNSATLVNPSRPTGQGEIAPPTTPVIVGESATPILDKSIALNQSLEKMRAGIETTAIKEGLDDAGQSKHAATRVATAAEGINQLASLQNSLRSSAPVQMQMPPGTPPTAKNWGRAVADKVYIAASQNLRVANIHLDPPELGALQVRLQVTGPDQQMTVSFSSPHASVRDTLEQQLPKLREMLEEQGINLGESSVNDQKDGSDQMGGDGERQGSGNYADSAETEGPVNPLNTQGTLALVDFYA